MKPYTNQEIKEAKKIAYNHLYSPYYIRWNKYINVDLRTRIGVLAREIFNQEKQKVNKAEIIEKQKERQKNKIQMQFTPIFKQPLLKDYINNGGMHLKSISEKGLHFYGRNHWAKNEKDFKILLILKKHFYKNIAA